MKTVSLLLISFLIVAAAAAQTSPDAPQLLVVKKQWYMEVNNPAFEKSPFGAIEELQQTNRDRRSIRRQNEVRARRGLPPLRTPNGVSQPDNAANRSPNVYTYKVKFKNEGAKTIRSLIWDYVFFEPNTEREVGRIQFESLVNIRPGDTESLSVSTIYPPSDSIDVKQTGRKFRDQYSERIVIQKIEYADATVWNLPQTPLNN